MSDSTTDQRPESRPTSRRGFLKIVALSGLAVGLGAAANRQLERTAVRVTRVLMGTVVNIALVGGEPGRAESALAAALAEMGRLIEIFDHRLPGGALGRLNANGILGDAPPELTTVLAHALAISASTSGAFDVSVKPILDAYANGQTNVSGLRRLVDYREITLVDREIQLGRPGMALTLDGLAKGRVVDGGVAALRDHGFTRVFVEAGGDLLASGVGPAEAPWRVGIQDPRGAAGDLVQRLSIVDRAAATSGDYLHTFTADRTLHHILDPRTLQSPQDLSSVTVLAPTVMEADALSTALMVMGPIDGPAWVATLPGVEALWITKDNQRLASPGFPTT